MSNSSLRGLYRRARAHLRRELDAPLMKASGVIHVGANTGQERDQYERYGLRVLWIEPIPEVFRQLQANLAGYERQRALQYLVTDQDGADYTFNVANNSGASSSILDLKDHVKVWPEVGFTKQIALTSTTLPALLAREQIDPADYDALVMDTQGTELMVLQGAAPLLRHFRSIKTEAADFELYAGCCQLADVDNFLTGQGFREWGRKRFAGRDGVGNCYEVTYQR